MMSADARALARVAKLLAVAAALTEIYRDAGFLLEAGVTPSAAQLAAWRDEITAATA